MRKSHPRLESWERMGQLTSRLSLSAFSGCQMTFIFAAHVPLGADRQKKFLTTMILTQALAEMVEMLMVQLFCEHTHTHISTPTFHKKENHKTK